MRIKMRIGRTGRTTIGFSATEFYLKHGPIYMNENYFYVFFFESNQMFRLDRTKIRETIKYINEQLALFDRFPKLIKC